MYILCVYVRVCAPRTRVCVYMCVCALSFHYPRPAPLTLLRTGPNSVFSSPFFPPRRFLLYSSHLLPNPLSYLALKKKNPTVQFVC